MSISDGSREERARPSSDPTEVLEDLEAQAAAWSRDERDVEVADRAVEAYRSVTLAARLVASMGREIAFDLGRAGRVQGRLVAAGDGWASMTVGRGDGEVLVLTEAATGVRGVVDGAAAAAAWPLSSRRSLGAMILRLAADGAVLTLTLRDGERRRGRAGRLGADFLELTDEEGQAILIRIDAIATVQQGRSAPRA